MLMWTYPKAEVLKTTEIVTKDLSLESSLYASGGHRGELTWH